MTTPQSRMRHFSVLRRGVTAALLALALAGCAEVESELRQQLGAALGPPMAAPAGEVGNAAEPDAAAVPAGTLPPLVRFPGSGYLLAGEAARGVEVSTVNVDALRLELIRVPEAQVRVLAERYIDLDGTQVRGSALRDRLEADATLVWSGTVTIRHTPDQPQSTLLPIQEVIANLPPGLFALAVADQGDETALLPSDLVDTADWTRLWRTEVPLRWILSTDIAISAARHADGMLLNLRSLASGEPLAGAQAEIVTRNGEVVFAGRSDAGGWIAVPQPAMRGRLANTPQQVRVRQGDDFAFLRLDASPLDLSRHDIGGRQLSHPADVFIFTDRGIYRPRETVHVHALVRDHAGRNTVQRAFDLSVHRPNGSVWLRQAVELAELGHLHQPVQLPADAPRGVWRVALTVRGEDRAAGQLEIDVQDFIPERLKVALSSPPGLLGVGRGAVFDVQADYLYGAPADGLGVEADAWLAPTTGADIPLPDWDGFLFGDDLNPLETMSLETRADPTDADGRTRITLTPPTSAYPSLTDGARASQPQRLALRVGVQEPGGRASQAATRALVGADAPALAVRRLFGEQVSAQSPAGFEVRRLAPTLETLPVAGLRWQVQHLAHRWYVDRSTGRWRHEPVLNRVISAEGAVLPSAADGHTGRIEVPPQGWGRYVLTVRDANDGVYLRHTYWSGWSSSAGSDVPDLLEVHGDNRRFVPGETLGIGIDAPFAGQGTLTVWTDRPVHSRNIRFEAGRNHIELDTQPEWTPGVYVVVSAVRALADGDEDARLSLERYLPARSLGVLHLQAETGRALAVELPPDRTLRPREQQALRVSVPELAGERALVLVQAVDEGILQLTRHPTPDPAEHYFGKRQLQVDLYDDYNRLLRGDGVVGELRTGGDSADADGSLAGAALATIPTRSTVLHAGPVALDARGEANLLLDVPDFNGRLRTMVTVWSADAFGSADGYWTVRDPLVAEAVLPRFLSPGDLASATLQLANTTARTLTAEVAISAEGAVAAEFAPRPIVLAPGESTQWHVPIGGRSVGTGALRLRLAVDGEPEIHREWPLSVQYLGDVVTLEGPAQPLAAGERVRLDLSFAGDGQDGLMSGGQLLVRPQGRGDWVSLLPQSLLGAAVLTELLSYPWACSEQIASQVTPALLAYRADPTFTARIARGVLGERALDAWLQGQIDRALARQHNDGSIGLWRRGDDLVDPELAVQLVEMLALARSAALAVPESALLDAYRWALDQVNEHLPSGPRRAAATARLVHAIAPHNPRAVRLARVLADTASDHDAITLSHLALALRQYGDQPRATQLIETLRTTSAAQLRQPAQDLPYYATNVSRTAELVTNLHLLGLTTQAETLGTELLALLDRRNEHGVSIHEQGHLLRAQLAAAGAAPIEVSWQGQWYRSLLGSLVIPLGRSDLEHGRLDGWLQSRTTRDLSATLRLQIPPQPGVSLPRHADQLRIERQVCTLDGEAVADGLDNARVNDRYVVLLTVDTDTASGRPRQLLVVDALPAGFQIESIASPQDRDGRLGWLPQLTHADAIEAVDTGFFAALLTGAPHAGYWSWYRRDRNVLHYAYIVRATTPGEYLATQAVVADMYDAGARAGSGGHPVRVWPAAAGAQERLRSGVRCAPAR